MRLRITRRTDQIDNVILHFVVDIDIDDHLARLQNLRRANHSSGRRRARGARHQVEDLAFLSARGITNLELQHEAVDLRFG